MITPLRLSRSDTQASRGTFLSRSSREKPRSAKVLAHVVPVQHLHAVPEVAQLARRQPADVDLPEPDSPVSHTHSPSIPRAGAASVP